MGGVDTQLLQFRQALDLPTKILMSQRRIRDFIDKCPGGAYVSFSGGKDSTVLLHLVRSVCEHVPAVFMDTGVEFPEIRQFVKTKDNVVWLKPAMPFAEVLDKYGYPVVSKEVAQKIYEVRTTKSEKLRNLRMEGRKNEDGKVTSRPIPKKWKYLIGAPFKISKKCCDILKGGPAEKYEKLTGRNPIIGTKAVDSENRKTDYMRHGCNVFESKRKKSTPLAFWTDADVNNYITMHNLDISPIYAMGYEHTGCIYCAFGCGREKYPNRFQRLQMTHPKLWDYCINKLGWGPVLDYCNVPYLQRHEQIELNMEV